ncbi:Hypothetical_protein [Hexamita inflata]|uniref:Hypothetical_protein n=1 Tax=Hexamita inflata TaxID=28002 RepID=A0AA86NDK8_9EUKA|nr:Hypothetical protein HINF_LOCUS4838 [Hexamita inflata]
METTSNQTLQSSSEYYQQLQTKNIEYLYYQDQEHYQQQETQEIELSSNEQQIIQDQWLKEYNIQQMLQESKTISNKESQEQEEQLFEDEISSTLYQKPTILLKPITFQILNLEETMEKIDKMLNISWKYIIHKNISIIPHNQGYILSFLIKPQYYDLILPLQDQLSVLLDDEKIDQNIDQNVQIVNSEISNPLQSQTSQQAPPVNKESALQQNTDGNQNKPTEPCPELKKELSSSNIITFLVEDVEQFLTNVEHRINQARSVFMYGKPNINKHITGRYILSFTAVPLYRDIIQRHYLDYQYSAVKISSKTNLNQASAHLIAPFQRSMDQNNQLSTRRATMLVDHVELFMSQVESAMGQHRSTFMNGDPVISQHSSGKYVIALDLFESYSNEILSKFGDFIYADKQQSQENPQPGLLATQQMQTEPEVLSKNIIQQESNQKAEAPSQLVNASENTAAQKQKAEPHIPIREVPVYTSHPVKFHVRNCEETLKAIESALKMSREKFIDGSSYISAGMPGYNLSFLVKSHVYEQVRSLQETLSIQTERIESVVKPEQQNKIQQQTTLLKNSEQKPCTAGTDSKLQSLQPEQKSPVKTDQPKFVPVNFHVMNCEETLKSIESILKIPRERFIHGKSSVVSKKPGFSLQFVVEPEYLEQIKPLQQQLSINMQVQANQFSDSLAKEQSQTSQQAPPVNKESALQQNTDGNQNKPTEPCPELKKELSSSNIITFLVEDVEQFLTNVEHRINQARSVFMYGKPNINKHITGRYILSFTAVPLYRDIIQRHYLDYQYSAVKISSKTNLNQASAHLIAPFQRSMDQNNQLSTRRATMLVDHVELFMSQVESAMGQHRSTFMNGDPVISQHSSGKYVIALDLFESYSDEILSKFGDFIYADKQQSQENPQPGLLATQQMQTEPEVLSKNIIQQESNQKAEAPSQLVNASENTAAQKQKAEPHIPIREVPVYTSHPVKFHVRNCEETLKAIESALKMSREKFIDGSSYISAGMPGYNLSFLVKSHVYEQVRSLQETLSIQTERIESVVKPEQQNKIQQQTTLLKNSEQKPCTAGTDSKLQSLQPEQKSPVKTDQPKFVPVNFHVMNCEETLKSIESILKIPRERFIHGKSSVVSKKPGFSLQFVVEPEYLEQVQSLQKQLLFQLQQQIINQNIEQNQKMITENEDQEQIENTKHIKSQSSEQIYTCNVVPFLQEQKQLQILSSQLTQCLEFSSSELIEIEISESQESKQQNEYNLEIQTSIFAQVQLTAGIVRTNNNNEAEISHDLTSEDSESYEICISDSDEMQ